MSINGYLLDDWGISYKVHLPKNPRYTRKDRPAQFTVVTDGIKDTLQNVYHYCFYTYIDRTDDTVRFDYDDFEVDDPGSFYNLLQTKLQKEVYLSPTDRLRFEHAGMVTLDGSIVCRIANCLVEELKDSKDGRLNALESLNEEELIHIAQKTLSRHNAKINNGTFQSIQLPKDKEAARQKLLSFITKHNVVMGSGISRGRGRPKEIILPQNHVYIYDPKREPGTNFEDILILRSAGDMYYIVQFYRKVSLKILAGLNTLSKRSNRDYPNLPVEPNVARVVSDWLEQTGISKLIAEDVLPDGMLSVRLGDNLEIVNE